MNAEPRRLEDAEILTLGRDVFVQEAAALSHLAPVLGDAFVRAVRVVLDCRGRVIVTGLGKSGLIARKLAATLTATGTPSHFLHPVEATHGDLGIAGPGDVLVAVSRSGDNPEVTQLAGLARHFGMTMIAMTGRTDSELARLSDLVLDCSVDREACPLDLTPTTSATAASVMGDALAVALLTLRGFTREDFAAFHPSGVLGRSLLMRVDALMHGGEELPVVSGDTTLRDCLPVLVEKRLGCACVVDDAGVLLGICVDGDVKRFLLEFDDPLDRPVRELMSREPATIAPDALALGALRRMEERPGGPITLLVVVDPARRPLGILHIHDILQAGIV
jgi:arabinose-5-phosphate isomerase